MPQILRRRAGGVPPMQMERCADWLGRVGWRGGGEGGAAPGRQLPSQAPMRAHTQVTDGCVVMGRREDGGRESARLGGDGMGWMGSGVLRAWVFVCVLAFTPTCVE